MFVPGPEAGQDFRDVDKTFSIKHFAVSAALLLTGLVSCARPEAPRRIVLVSLDTFRADLLDATWPDGRPLTPNLRALAAQSRRYDRAFAPMPFTLPSHMTMVTGMHPESHYVVTKKHRLAEEIPTLAEMLRARGYRTAGIVSSSWLKGSFGFDRGFDSWEEVSEDALSFADRINALAAPELERSAKSGGAFFSSCTTMTPTPSSAPWGTGSRTTPRPSYVPTSRSPRRRCVTTRSVAQPTSCSGPTATDARFRPNRSHSTASCTVAAPPRSTPISASCSRPSAPSTMRKTRS